MYLHLKRKKNPKKMKQRKTIKEKQLLMAPQRTNLWKTSNQSQLKKRLRLQFKNQRLNMKSKRETKRLKQFLHMILKTIHYHLHKENSSKLKNKSYSKLTK